jgi:hypothetical protein
VIHLAQALHPANRQAPDAALTNTGILTIARANHTALVLLPILLSLHPPLLQTTASRQTLDAALTNTGILTIARANHTAPVLHLPTQLQHQPLLLQTLAKNQVADAALIIIGILIIALASQNQLVQLVNRQPQDAVPINTGIHTIVHVGHPLQLCHYQTWKKSVRKHPDAHGPEQLANALKV